MEHETIDGELLTVEAEDHNSVLWQHELDHLDGILYTDKLLGELLPMDEVRRLRKEADDKAKGVPVDPTPVPAEADSARYDFTEGSSFLVASSHRRMGDRV